MKTLNVRLVAILLGSAAVGFLVLCGIPGLPGAWGLWGGIYGYQVRRTADFYLQQGEKAIARADRLRDQGGSEQALEGYREAHRFYAWYLRFRPDDTDVLERLGLLQAELAELTLGAMGLGDARSELEEKGAEARGWLRGAAQTLERVVRQERGSGRPLARRKLAAIYRGAARYLDAQQHLEALLKTAPDDGELLEMLARCQSGARDYGQAAETFERAIKHAPEQVRAYQLLADLLADRNRLNRPTEADQWMRKLLESNPDSSQAHLAYGQHLARVAGTRSIDQARKHRILLDAMVPAVLMQAVQRGLESLELAADDPDARLMAENKAILVQAVRDGLKRYDSNLPLDDPGGLLLAARRGSGPGEPDRRALTQAKDAALKVLAPDAGAGGRDPLAAAEKHGMVLKAMQQALEAFHDPTALISAARGSVFDEAVEHAVEARRLVADGRDALKLAAEHAVLIEAMREALADVDEPAALRLTASRDAVRKALDGAIRATDSLGDRGKKLLTTAHRVLVDAIRRASLNRKLASVGCETLLRGGDDGVLAGVVARAVKAHDTALERLDREGVLLAARCALTKARTIASQSPGAASERSDLGEYDRARAYAKVGIDLYPKDARMYSMLAEIESRAGRQEEAIRALEDGLREAKSAVLIWSMVNHLIEAGEIRRAKAAMDELRKAKYPEHLVGYLEARIAYEQGQWLRACRGFEQVRGGLAGSPRLLKWADCWLGDCYGQLENVDQQLKAYRRALDVDRFFIPAKVGLAEALAGAGQDEEALTQYRQLMQVAAPPAGGLLPLARLLLQRNMRLEPSQRNWEEVERVLDRAADSDPGSPAVAILRSQVLVAQDRLEQAEAVLSAARDHSAEPPAEIWTALASVAQNKQQWDQAEAVLNEAERKLGDQVAIRLGRAQLLVRRDAKAAAEPLRELARRTEGFSEADRVRLWRTLASFSKQAGDDQQAKKLCRWVADREPNNLPIRLELLNLAFRAGDHAAIKRTLEEVQQVEGKGPHWHYGEALRLMVPGGEGGRGAPKQALKHLAQARKLYPSWPPPVVLAADIYGQQGNPNLALKNYLHAINELGSRDPRAVTQAAAMLYQQRRYKEAAATFRLLEEWQIPLSPGGIRLVRDVKFRAGDLDGALGLARKAAADSDDYRDHLVLGQILTKQGGRARANGNADQAQNAFARAEQALRRALESAEEVPETWVAMVQFLAGTGEAQKAEEAIEEARNKIPAAQRPLALAQCYGSIGRVEEAEKYCEEAMAAAPEDPAVARYVADFYLRKGQDIRSGSAARSEAILRSEAVLKRIIGGEVEGTEADVIWARRQLAYILATRGDYQSLQESLRLIEANLATAGPNAPDLRLKAMVLTNHPAPAKQQQAAQILENLPGGERAVTEQDRWMLWKLYLAENAWSKASAQMRSLLAAAPDRPDYLVAYTSALLERNELREAELWLGRLERMAPNHVTTMSLRAELLFRRAESLIARAEVLSRNNQADQASARLARAKSQLAEVLDLVNGFVGRPDAQPRDETERLRQVALRLEQFAGRLREAGRDEMAKPFATEAEARYRQYVLGRPGQELFLVAFLGRQGHMEEALRRLKSAWEDGNPVTIAQVCVTLLRSPHATRQPAERVEEIVQKALDRFDRPIPLLLVMAEVCASQERYQEAEKFYREVIQKNSGHYVAMNNLAVLLALQGNGDKAHEALRLITRAIELAGPVPSMLDSRATVHLALGQPRKALADLDRVIAQEATPVRYFHQARAYQQSNQPGEALRAMEKANELGLQAEMLEPLERPAYQRLQKLLQNKVARRAA